MIHDYGVYNGCQLDRVRQGSGMLRGHVVIFWGELAPQISILLVFLQISISW